MSQAARSSVQTASNRLRSVVAANCPTDSRWSSFTIHLSEAAIRLDPHDTTRFAAPLPRGRRVDDASHYFTGFDRPDSSGEAKAPALEVTNQSPGLAPNSFGPGCAGPFG